MAPENDTPKSQASDKDEAPEPTIRSGRSESESPTVAGPTAADDRTVAFAPESDETQSDRTMASPATELKESDKPTKVSPEPGKTQSDQAPARTTISDSSQDRILQGRYQIKKTLGKGGFGAAYLAEGMQVSRMPLGEQAETRADDPV